MNKKTYKKNNLSKRINRINTEAKEGIYRLREYVAQEFPRNQLEDACDDLKVGTFAFESLLRSGEPNEYLHEIGKFFLKGNLHLSTISFDIVDGCQLRCIGCPNSTYKPKVNPVNIEDIHRRVANINIKEVDRIRLYRYGEPLFHNNLKEVLEIFKVESEFKIGSIVLSTNAQYHNFDSLMPALDSGLLDELSISADGDGTPESYEYYRPPGKWDRLIEFISKVSSYITMNNINTKLTLGTILPTVTTQSKLIADTRMIDKWKKIMQPYNISSYDFRPMLLMPGSSLSDNQTFDTQSDFYKPGNGLCKSVMSKNLYVDGKGFVQPCCHALHVRRIGDLNTTKYTDILFTSFFDFYDELRDKRSQIPGCSVCPQ